VAQGRPDGRQTVAMDRTVSCSLQAQVLTPASVELQVAVAREPAEESLVVTLDGEALDVQEVAGPVGGRMHLLRCGPGALRVDYSARVGDAVDRDTVDRAGADRAGADQPSENRAGADPLEVQTYLRPSRYAESDRLVAVARAELGDATDPATLARAAVAFVRDRLRYVSGSSRVTDGAVDTLLAGAGVCRDYAHLTVALLRARDVPARLVSVYAPGLRPMDFHAVVEVLVDGTWCVVDSTGLAPRPSMVRIATGRDAADTAFMSSYGGGLRFERLEVRAVVDGELPVDDRSALVRLD
jgi:transglutaminase-like putative cysteine protease